MIILVAGSSGLVGSALVQVLSTGGHEVRRLVRRSPEQPGDYLWDPAKGEIDTRAVLGVEAVIHLGGAGIGDKRWSREYKELLVSSRLDSTRLIADTIAATNHPPHTFLCASAMGYYGETGEVLNSETSPVGDTFLAELCSNWELVSRRAEDVGTRVVNLRFGVALSPTGGALKKQLLPFKLALGGRLGPGNQWLSWISLSDTIRAIEYLLESELQGPVNICAPNPCTNLEFTKALGAALKRPTILPVPMLVPRLLLGQELVSALLLSSIRVDPQKLLNDGFVFRDREIKPALKRMLA